MIRPLKINPSRAANIFGPALIKFSFIPKYLIIAFDEIPMRLNFERSFALKKKSIARKTTGTILGINPVRISNKTVKIPLIRETRSLMFLSETGHNAYVFIL